MDDDIEAVPTVPYEEASITVPSELMELQTAPVDIIADAVTKIVSVEGPIHRDEVCRRTATLWGLSRAGSRIRNAVGDAIGYAAETGFIVERGDFLDVASDRNVRIRNRENVSSADLRKPESLPPEEIRAAAVALVEHHIGMAKDDVVTAIARLFGFKSTSAKLKAVVEAELTRICA